jgi:hypothetical protein
VRLAGVVLIAAVFFGAPAWLAYLGLIVGTIGIASK